MYLIDENKLLMGAAINFNDICWIYPLTIGEIIAMGELKYSQMLSLLTMDMEKIKDELFSQEEKNDLKVTILDYYYMLINYDNSFLLKLQEAFSTFIKEEVHFSPDEKKIFIGEEFSPNRVLTEENFSDFQNILRKQNGMPVPEPIPENENAMERKFRLRREQVKEAKRRQARKDGEAVSLSDSITTLVCFNIGYTYSSIRDLTYYQFQSLLSRAQAKYKYDLDLRMIAAGADSKKIKPKPWFGKLED